MSNSLGPHELQPARLLCPWGFSRQEYWSGFPCPSPGDLPKPGIKPKSPTLQVDFLPYEPPGKPKHTGVCSLSLLQGIFSTQESNQCLLHCRGIFYQLSYQGSPQVVQTKNINKETLALNDILDLINLIDTYTMFLTKREEYTFCFMCAWNILQDRSHEKP